MEQQTTVEWFVKNVESISNNKSFAILFRLLQQRVT